MGRAPGDEEERDRGYTAASQGAPETAVKLPKLGRDKEETSPAVF